MVVGRLYIQPALQKGYTVYILRILTCVRICLHEGVYMCASACARVCVVVGMLYITGRCITKGYTGVVGPAGTHRLALTRA